MIGCAQGLISWICFALRVIRVVLGAVLGLGNVFGWALGGGVLLPTRLGVSIAREVLVGWVVVLLLVVLLIYGVWLILVAAVVL